MLTTSVLFSGIGFSLLATITALTGAIAGLWLSGAWQRSRLAVPFSGGLLMGVAIFGVLPELVHQIGWATAISMFVAGHILLFSIDRYIHPVCPSCSCDHDHQSCTTVLHGFAAPLISAAAVHSFLDGWSIITAQSAGPLEVRLAVPFAIMLHKVPEGVALGAILRASVPVRLTAFGWCAAAESMTLLGSGLGLVVAPYLGTTWIYYPLAIAGGCFSYLGFHAIHGEWRRRGAMPVFVPALTGAAGAAALQQGVRALLK